MPTYDFACRKCGQEFQVEESLQEHGRQHPCSRCMSPDTFQLFRSLVVVDSGPSKPRKDEDLSMEDMGPPGMPPGMCGHGGFCGM
jgi:putative FmdB family regulatory protein